MFDILNTFLSKIALSFGGFLVLIGTSLSGTAAVEEKVLSINSEEVLTSSSTSSSTSVQNKAENISTHSSSPYKESATKKILDVPNEISVKKPSSNAEVTPIAPSDNSFSIKDLSLKTTNKEATGVKISWTTTRPSRSRVQLGDSTYESGSGISTNHSITIEGLEARKTYKYKITARTQEDIQIEDDLSGTYFTIPDFLPYTVTKGSKTDSCQIFYVVDSYGKRIPNLKVKISAESGKTLNGYRENKSDSNGAVNYCAPITQNPDVSYKVLADEVGHLTM